MVQMTTDEWYNQKYIELKKFEFHFSVNEADQHGWQASSSKKEFYNSNQLAELSIRLLLDKAAALRKMKADKITRRM